MVDAGIQEGDILVVGSIQPEDNAIVIACVDNEFTVKYLRMDGESISGSLPLSFFRERVKTP
jgi:SOS-response transcriptional repressor LexA